MDSLCIVQPDQKQSLFCVPVEADDLLVDAHQFKPEAVEAVNCRQARLSAGHIQSLAGFAAAPSLERRCVAAVVARTDPKDLDEFRLAFLEADVDQDGQISRLDLTRAVNQMQLRVVLPAGLDIHAMFEAANTSGSGFLSFNEFVAGCLHSRLGPLDSWLAEQAFEALDHDHDGRVWPADVRLLFGELPRGLPVQASFGLDNWRHSVLDGAMRRSSAPPAFTVAERVGAGVEAATVPVPVEATIETTSVEPLKPVTRQSSFLDNEFFDAILCGCKQTQVPGQNSERVYTKDMEPSGRPRRRVRTSGHPAAMAPKASNHSLFVPGHIDKENTYRVVEKFVHPAHYAMSSPPYVGAL